MKMRWHCATCAKAFPQAKSYAYCNRTCERARVGREGRRDREDVLERMLQPLFAERLRLATMLETAAPGDRPSLLRQIHATEQQEDAVRDRVRLEVAGLAAPIATVEPTPDSVAAVAPAVRQAADRWESAMRHGIEAALELGQRLIEAKAALRHGQWMRLFRGHPQPMDGALPFSVHWASRIMGIARCSALRDPAVRAMLPADTWTLHTLSRLPEAQLRAAIAAGTVHPELHRDEALRLIPQNRRVVQIDPRAEAAIAGVVSPLRAAIARFAADHPSLVAELKARVRGLLRAAGNAVEGSGGTGQSELMGGAQRACMRS